jgi:CheY-like chemotaxis protein
MIAEDDDSVRVLVGTVLTDAGYKVLEARSGPEAAALLETITDPIDLLITDIVMPGMIGPDLAHLVQEKFPQTRLLYITGYATHTSVPPRFLHEDDGLLAKPFLPEQLLTCVQERLGLAT